MASPRLSTISVGATKLGLCARTKFLVMRFNQRVEMSRILNKTRQIAIQMSRSVLHRAGLSIVRADRLKQIIETQKSEFDIGFVRHFESHLSHKIIDALGNSKAQLRQDILALICVDWKRGGFFVEFGATDGVGLSNTHFLEKDFGWDGILAEPARVWHNKLKENRNCIIDLECVWSQSGQMVDFCETPWSEISTSLEHINSDSHGKLRKYYDSYQVKSITLNDLLVKHDAPRRMDYLSIDTEGSEFDILNKFDFEKYSFQLITCEHNYSPNRERIHSLLTRNGYVRILQDVSQFDDWYVDGNIVSCVPVCNLDA